MNAQTENTGQKKRGVVVNFPLLSEKLLYNMRLDVGLSMKVDFLRFLQRHYRDTEKRDPSLDELYFLDRYLALLGAGASPIGELLTDSPYLAETYADLLEKLNATSRSDAAPALFSLASVAGRYLARSGKASSLEDFAATAAGESAELRLILSGYIPRALTDEGAVGQLVRRASADRPAPGGILITLSPAAGMGAEAFTDAVYRTLRSDGGAGFRRGEIIGPTGVAGAVSNLCYGASLDLAALPGVTAESELTELCDAAHGHVLAALDRTAAGAFIGAAGDAGLTASVVGSISSAAALTVMHRDRSPFSLNMNFIRTLARHTEEKFILRDQRRGSAGGDIKNSRAYDASSGLLLSTVTADTASDPFFMSLDALLTATAGCVAGGAAFTDIGLSLAAEIPAVIPDPQDISGPVQRGDALSLILGAYRAQLEYCLPDTGSVFSYCGRRFGFAVSAAAKPAGRPVPAQFAAPGNNVYLLSPRCGPDGLPDFEDLRRLWNYVAALCRDGLAASSHALASRGAAGAIDALSSGGIGFEAGEGVDKALIDAPAPGGVVIESPARLKGILIGRTIAPGRHMSI